ncbi:MAG: alkaline phosphatase D family protein [Gemmataceae bacterium]
MLDLHRLADAIRYEGGLSRRLWLAYTATLAALPTWASRAAGPVVTRPVLANDPFTLGVASGDPDSTSVVLWTRLAPRPLDPDGGMKPQFVAVTWELAQDEAFKKILKSGTTLASPALGHSVHVEVKGLKPDSRCFYRFRVGDAVSPVGQTRTLPAADRTPEKLRFAFASCQHFESGLYTAYEDMAKHDLDLVFHLGDYIYEGAGRGRGGVRKHVGPKLKTLADYRVRHAQYRGDAALQAMHAKCPWFVTWDDHEVENNYANDISERAGVDPVAFLQMRANAYQAYYEAMPLRARSIPRGPDMLLYRKASFGRLAEFFVLDTRQYRTDQPNGDGLKDLNDAALAPTNTILGRQQRNWLQAGLLQSTATWNVLAQQVMMAMVNVSVPGVTRSGYIMDQWPGYAFERMELLRWIAERKIPNPVVLTGDIHSNWVNELRVDDRKQETPVVAVEFVGTSITSGGNGSANPFYLPLLQRTNPFVKFHNLERGYVRCEVTATTWRSDYVGVTDVLKPGGKVEIRKSFVVEAGQPGVKLA